MLCKFCHHIKINSSYGKYIIYSFGKGLEDSPFIIRFKTFINPLLSNCIFISSSLEDSPFIIRFKTVCKSLSQTSNKIFCLEDSPFIIRFKTHYINII